MKGSYVVAILSALALQAGEYSALQPYDQYLSKGL